MHSRVCWSREECQETHSHCSSHRNCLWHNLSLQPGDPPGDPAACWPPGDPPLLLTAPPGQHVENKLHTLWFNVAASEAGVKALQFTLDIISTFLGYISSGFPGAKPVSPTVTGCNCSTSKISQKCIAIKPCNEAPKLSNIF